MTIYAYRCVECGHGAHLNAWAGCNAYGPLDPRGTELTTHDTVEEWGIHTDSIECSEHPGAVIEHRVDGEWRRWFWCDWCNGSGNTGDRYYYRCNHCEPGKSQGWLTRAPSQRLTAQRS